MKKLRSVLPKRRSKLLETRFVTGDGKRWKNKEDAVRHDRYLKLYRYLKRTFGNGHASWVAMVVLDEPKMVRKAIAWLDGKI